MKRLNTMVAGLAVVLLAQSPALAMGTVETSANGVMAGLFAGFCALLVVMQLMPTLLLLLGAINSFCRKNVDSQDFGQGI